jgi:hypothetical protein
MTTIRDESNGCEEKEEAEEVRGIGEEDGIHAGRVLNEMICFRGGNVGTRKREEEAKINGKVGRWCWQHMFVRGDGRRFPTCERDGVLGSLTRKVRGPFGSNF